MKRIKLIFAAFAAITGIGGAFVSSAVSASAPSTVHDWVNLNNVTVFINLTTAQAQTLCAGSWGICLKAKDNFNITTHGSLK